MPSILEVLGRVIDECQESELHMDDIRTDERLKDHSLKQLRALEQEVQAAVKRLPDSTLRSANQALLQKVQKEIVIKETLHKATLGKELEEQAQQKKAKEQLAFKNKEKKAVLKMFEAKALYNARVEVRDAEAQHYAEERSKTPDRRIRATRTRTALYTIAAGCVATGLTLWAQFGWFGLYVGCPFLAVAPVLVYVGRVRGEMWRQRVTTEKEYLQKIDRRTEELVAKLREKYKADQKAEAKRRKQEEAQAKTKKAEQKKQQHESELRAEGEYVKQMEEGRMRMLMEQRAALRAVTSQDSMDSYADSEDGRRSSTSVRRGSSGLYPISPSQRGEEGRRGSATNVRRDSTTMGPSRRGSFLDQFRGTNDSIESLPPPTAQDG